MANEGFAKRLEEAYFAWLGRRRERLPQKQIARRVAKIVGGEPVSQQTVSNWFKGIEPDYNTAVALGRVLEVSPAWLAFGEGQMLPAMTGEGAVAPATPPLAPPGPKAVRAKTPRERGKAARKRREA